MDGKIKILIVEDHAPTAEMAKILLEHAGCVVQIADTGISGMELALQCKFSAILLDIDLPDKNGIEICRELKQRHFSRRTPIIFVSGRPHAEDIRRGYEVGAVDYIEKPFKPNDFVRRILLNAETSKKTTETLSGKKS